MKHKSRKLKFLTVKLKSMQSELEISKEILQTAATEVEKIYREKYIQQDKTTAPESTSEMEEYSEPEQRAPPSQEGVSETSNPEPEPKEPPNPEDVLESSKKNADPKSKKIFRKIATKIHPDKLAQIEDEYEKEVKRRLYSKAITAFEEGDILLLAEIAIDLGIDVPEIDEQRLQLTERKISSIKEEIKVVESTMVWHWFFCEDVETKERILNKLLELMHEKYTRS